MDEALSPWPEPGLPWATADPMERGGAEFGDMLRAERDLLRTLAGAGPPAEVMREVATRLDELTALLARHQVPEAQRFDGWRIDLPGRGMALLPEYVEDEETGDSARGRVTFTRYHLGGNGAVHGGVLPLLFDEVLGKVTNHGRPIARTAYLKVNYRRITPIDVELTWDAKVDGVEGRKRYGSSRLYNPAGEVVADSEALFVQLLAHHQ